MPKFVKKPVEIEARQYYGNANAAEELINWIESEGGKAYWDKAHIVIETLEGKMEARADDWIIKGVKGEFYPCKPDIFEETYESLY